MDSIKIIRGNDTDLVARIRRKEGDVTSPYDLTGAGKIRVAVVGQGAHIFAKDVTVDGNALSFRIPGRPLHLGKHTLEITFTLDGYDKRIAGRDMVEVVESLVDSTEMTAVEEGAAIEFTLTVTPEVIDLGGFSGNYDDLDNKPDLSGYYRYHLAESTPSEIANPMEGDICHVSDYEDSVKPLSALGYNSLDLTPYSGYKIRLKRIGTLYNGDITVTKSDNTTETLNTATDLPRTYDAGVVTQVSAVSSSVMQYSLGVYRLYTAEFEYVKGAWEERGESLKFTFQALTNEQKQQARTNIGAASAAGAQGYHTEDISSMLAKEGDILYLAPQAYAINLQNSETPGNISIQGTELRISRTAIFSSPFGKITITGSYPGLGSGTLGTIEEVEIDGFSMVCVIDQDNVRHPLYYGQPYNLSTVINIMGTEMQCPRIAIAETHEDGQTSMLSAVTIDDWRELSIKELRNGNWVDRLPAVVDNAPTQNSQNLVKSGGVYDAIAAKYTKPQTGIPATDLAAGVIPDISGKQNIYAVPTSQISSPKEGDITKIDESTVRTHIEQQQGTYKTTGFSQNDTVGALRITPTDYSIYMLPSLSKVNIYGSVQLYGSALLGTIEAVAAQPMGQIIVVRDADGVAHQIGYDLSYDLNAIFRYLNMRNVCSESIMLEEIIEEGQTSILTCIDSINSVYPERIFEYQKGAWRNRKAYTLEFDSTPTTGSDKLVNSGCVAKNTQLFFSVDALTPPTNPKEGDIWDRPAYSQVCPSMSGIGYFPTATLPVTIPLADGATSINITIYKTDSTQEVLTDISEFPKTYPAGVVSAFAIYPAIGTPTQDLPAAKMVYHSGSWVDIDTMFASQQIQSDWNQADNTARDYIKNKPTIPAAIDTVNVTVGNNTGTPTGSGSVSGSTLNLAFDNIKGPRGADGNPGQDGQNGTDGVGIASVVQTTESTDPGGTNEITVTKTDGTTSKFRVRNGDGVGTVTVVQTTGNSTTSAMSQKGVTDALETSRIYAVKNGRVTYFKDYILDYDFADFPTLNPFDGDVVGVILDLRRYGSLDFETEDARLFAKSSDNSNYIKIIRNGHELKVKTKKAGGSENVSTIATIAGNYCHNILAINMTTGECGLWTNGAPFWGTVTNINPTILPDQSLLTHITLGSKSGSTAPYGKAGIAVINFMPTDDLAKEIYDRYSSGGFVPPTMLSDSFVGASGVDDMTSYNVDVSEITGGWRVTNKPNVTSSDNAYLRSDFITDDDRSKYTRYSCHVKVLSGSVTIVGFDMNGRLNTTAYNSQGVSQGLSKDMSFNAGDEYDLEYFGTSSGNGPYLLNYKFTAAFSFEITDIKKIQCGCPIVATPENLFGGFFEQPNGVLVPMAENCQCFTDIYKPRIVGSDANQMQFNGQMRYDTNGKLYIGYMYGNTQVWKQINNA